ncbi:hypothetical protein QBC37DRAFT_421998 [Rhypophila decipiens]|uniref:RRM domain-containing protein n=1 Tax=Rhypophila decipiens TaxID=261697 RepID=A0AAN6Y7Y1_9PEZI|nr:hypothetical protein QBC37DRAFT_421998 [Rhypophila decipiens]
MGKSSSKKRERVADEDVAANGDSTILKKTKVDESGKAHVTKEAAAEDSVKPKKEKKEKKDKSEKKDKADKAEKKKEKKEKSTSKTNAADDPAKTASYTYRYLEGEDEEEAEVTAAAADEDASPKKSKKDKKEKKEKKEKKSKKSKKSKSEKQEDDSEDKMDIDGDDNEPQQDGGADDEEGGQEATEGGGKKARFICFIGNLPFDATVEQIQAHFASVHPTSVRLLSYKDSKKGKGACFIEFAGYDHMKTCLAKFHNTEFNDGVNEPRKIRVELTAGGGGNTPHRQEKIKEKNKKLDEERLNRMKKEEAAKAEKQKANGTTAEPAAGEDASASAAKPEETGIHPSRLGRVPFTEGYDENAQDADYDASTGGYGGGGGRRGGRGRGGGFRGKGRGGGGRGGGGRGRGRR